VVTEPDFVIALRHLTRVTIFDSLAARRVELTEPGNQATQQQESRHHQQ
jgi:hypothetical protein